MNPFAGQYLHAYVRRKRRISLANASLWSANFVIGCLILWSRLAHSPMALPPKNSNELTVIAIGVLSIPLLPMANLFRRFDPIKVAIEIERRCPAFDQQLITLATAQEQSPLLNQLADQTRPLAPPPKSLLSLRRLFLPSIVLAILLATAV